MSQLPVPSAEPVPISEMVQILNEVIPRAVTARNRNIKIESGDQSFSDIGLDSLDRLVILTFVLDLYQIETDVQESPAFDSADELQEFVHARSSLRFPNRESVELALKAFDRK
jgi:acyl carrier protein